MYYGSGTVAHTQANDASRAWKAIGQLLHMQRRTAVGRHVRHLESMTSYRCVCIYFKNNSAQFYPDLILNDIALCFFEDRRPNNKNKKKNKISNDIDQFAQFLIQNSKINERTRQ